MRPPVGGRLVVREPACSLCPSCAPHRDGRTPARVELADTPFFPQTRYQCGPTALATVLNARGVTVTPDELVPRVYLPAREGSLQAEIKAAVRRQGLLAVPVEPGLDAPLAEITAGHPVLVLQNLGFNWLPRWHYAVVVGYDLARQELVLRSGTEPRRITPFGVFLNTWNRSARWGIVVLVPGAFPAQAKPTPYLEVASALERLGQHQWASIRKPGRLTRHRPQDGPTIRWHGMAWLGLGNTEYALGHGEPAEVAFRHALQDRPGVAVVWNNPVYVLAARQCIRQARESARCATRIGPENTNFTHTLKEMESLPGSGAGSCLPLPACPAR